MDARSINPLTLPSLPLTARRDLPDTPAIYFALASDSTVLYIGKARRLSARWHSTAHHRHTQLSAYSDIRIAWLSVSDAGLLDGIERACIEHFQPPLNGSPSPSPVLMLRLPPDLYRQVRDFAGGYGKYPPTTMRAALIFLIEGGLRALGD